MRKLLLLLVCCWLVASLKTSVAVAQLNENGNPYSPEFLFSIGYGNFSLGSGGEVGDKGGIRFDPVVSFSPLTQVPQLRLGADLGVLLVLDNTSGTIIINNGSFYFHGTGDIPLWTLEPEVTLSWRQNFGDQNQFFIEPGIAGGVMSAFLSLKPAEPEENSYSASSSTGYGRFFLRGGMQTYNLLGGVEASFLEGGNLNFGHGASGSVSEYYFGLFGAIQF